MLIPLVVSSRLRPVPSGAVDDVSETGKVIFGIEATARWGDVEMEDQKGGEWCWAAVAVNVQRMLDRGNLSQCAVVTAVLNHPAPCCDAGGRALPECDNDHSIDEAFDAVGVQFDPKGRPLGFAVVRGEIDALPPRPVVCLIDFPPPSVKHFVQIIDYIEGSTRKFVVFDPISGSERDVSEDEILTNYDHSGGKWNYTYLVS